MDRRGGWWAGGGLGRWGGKQWGCSGPFTALGNPFVPGSASSPSVLKTCSESSQFSSSPPFHLYFPHSEDDLPWDILTSQEASAG